MNAALVFSHLVVFFVGAAFGVLVVAMCVAAKKGDEGAAHGQG